MVRLEKLYEIVMNYGKKLRKKFPDENFKKHWTFIEELVDPIDQNFSEWYKEVCPGGVIYAAIGEKALDLPEKIVTGKGVEQLIEHNHYLIETFRTPQTKEPTLKNILFIGFNFGLLTGQIRQKDFPEGLVKILKDLKVYQIVNYLSSTDASLLEKQISDEFLKEIDLTCKKQLKTLTKNRISKLKTSDTDSNSDSDSD